MSLVMPGLARFVWLPLIVAAITVLPILARLILGPISQAAGYLKAPTRFQLSDFAWLLFMLQATLAVCVQFIGLESRGYFVVILAFLTFAVSALWAGAVSFLANAGVTHPPRRAAFILVVLPATLAILIGLPAAIIASTFYTMNYFHRLSYTRTDPQAIEILVASAVAVGGLIAFFLVGWGLRRLSIWVAADGKLELPVANGSTGVTSPASKLSSVVD